MRLFEGTPFDIPPKCEHCGKLESECTCAHEVKLRIAPEKQTASLRVEKRKKGKVVTVVGDLQAQANDFSGLLIQLKNLCGAGGSIDGDLLEIQGDHVNRIADHLRKLGYRVTTRF